CWSERVTRVPVNATSRDEIRGVVDVRDALRARAEAGSLEAIMTAPVFVPGTKPVDELLVEMQRQNHRMVLVVDEFGTVVGLATFEDVIEEVVGEIFSHDEVDPIRVIDATEAVVAGWATVDYVNEILGLDLAREGPFVTIAGLVAYHTGRLAEEGDRVELGDVTITVLDATPRRILRVRIEWVEHAEAAR
ncbi:MAG: transporter associated domain-containing protein, partial [Halobacteriota archaeon]